MRNGSTLCPRLRPPRSQRHSTNCEAGNSSNVKGVGSGVFERKIDFGPGYRIYFGRDSDTLLILLGGSSKQRQQKAIVRAKTLWSDYRRRKR